MSDGYIINFVDKDGNNFDTISGKPAKWLIQHSALLQTFHEIEPTATTFTVPVDMPYGRQELFRKIIKGFPVAEWGVNNIGRNVVVYNPVSEEEEALIANIVKKGNGETTVQKEREKAVQDTLSFLMMDPEAEARMLRIQYPKNNNAREMSRRRNITKKRKNNIVQRLAQNAYHNTNGNYLQQQANEEVIPFLDEDTIEDLIEKHKDLLYGIYGSRYYSRVRIDKLLNKKNIEERDKKQEEYKKRRAKERTRRRRYHYNNNNYDPLVNNSNNERNFNLYNVELLEEYFKPFKNIEPHKMSSREFERYLRSLRREGEEKYLPYQGPLVGNLFGNTNNI
jgi:hypothetical protein